MSGIFATGNVAVITGAASGIGKAAAQHLRGLGMKLVLCDVNAAALESVAAPFGEGARFLAGDVSQPADVARLCDLAYDSFGFVSLLMNNAALGQPHTDNWPTGDLLSSLDAWHRIIDVNLWGVVNGVHAFAPAMLKQGRPGAIVNTGSKQGITNPPGEPAYAVSKAGVKVLTEQLAHGLRNQPGSEVTAHLLVPGWTFTGMSSNPDGPKPAGAWSADQVVERMVAGVAAGDFYIICPDNAVSSDVDAARLQWSADDMIQNRPALSRWHPAWQQAFDDFLANRQRK